MAARRTRGAVETEPEDLPVLTVPRPPLKEAIEAQQAALREWAAANPQSPGVFGAVVNAVETAASTVGNAVGSAASAVGNAVEAVAEVAENSVIAQAIAAAATGGLSLAAQLARDQVTGNEGAITRAAKEVVEDPLEVLKKLPGQVLTGTGAIGAAADLLSGAGAALGGLGGDSALGDVGRAVTGAVEGAQQAARDNPVESLQVIGGIAAAALGLPLGVKAIADGISGMVDQATGGGSEQHPSSPAPPEPPPPPPAPPLAKSSSSATRISPAAVAGAVAVGLVFVVGLVIATDSASA
jgi:hypothetical protein